MTDWELARYLIDAKKAVDGIWFIAIHGDKFRNISLRQEIDNRRSIFYINSCTVLDKSMPIIQKKKRELCDTDPIIKALYYERDKHYAHKDDDYHPRKYDTLMEIFEELRSQLMHVRDICSTALPQAITLDFVPHDKQLFRLLHKVSPEKEEELKSQKHPLYGCPFSDSEPTRTLNILQDTEDVRFLTPEEKENYATLVECGICSNESLQNFQDAMIKTNVLFSQNMWCQPDHKKMEEYNELRRLGYYNEFDIPQIPNLEDPIIRHYFLKDMKRIGLGNL